MAQVQYCNTTTDLVGAYARVESARDLRVLAGYKPHTVANVFKMGKVGSFESMYEDNTPMTAQAFTSDLATTLAALSAGEYYYDSTNDVLYFYPTGGVPDSHTYRVGEDWAQTKTRAVQDASRDADAILNVKYPTPIYFSQDGSKDAPYDRDLMKAVAKMACGHLMARIDPMQTDSLHNPTNISAQLYEEGRRVLVEYIEGKRVFSWEISIAEIGKYNIRATSGNTSEGMFQLRGEYAPTDVVDGSDELGESAGFADAFWKIKISTGGALGTAKFELSKDNGTTYSDEITTVNTWVSLSSGLWVRFLARAGTSSDFIVNDTWQIELYGTDRELTSPTIKTIPVSVI